MTRGSSGTVPERPRVRRVQALRLLFARHHLAESLAFAPPRFLRVSVLVGAEVALTLALALPLVLASPRPDLMGYASLGALVALFGRFAPPGRRMPVLGASALMQAGGILILSLVAWLGAPQIVPFLLLSGLAGLFFFASVTLQLGPPGALIFVFAAGASLVPPASLGEVFLRAGAAGAVSVVALIVAALAERLRRPGPSDPPFPVEPLRALPYRLQASARVAVGSALALLVADLVGLGHPAWAAMGAMAVLQGAHLHITLSRAVQRMAGTVAGALLTWLILIQDPSLAVVIGLVMILTVTTEIVIGLNYGLGLVLVTPMALLMTSLAPGQAGAEMAPERVLNTLIGVVIGLAVAVLLSTLDDRHHLAEQKPR